MTRAVHTLLELAPDPMLVVDPSGRVSAANARAEALFGYGAGELAGEPAARLLPTGWREGGELTAARRDGSELRAELSLAELDAPGGPAVLAAIRDAGGRSRDEAALREADERFRRVFEDGPIAMALVGEDFKLGEVNGAYCRLTGYNAAELAERTFADITHPDDIDVGVRLAQRVFADEIPSFSIDKRYVRKSGEAVWVALTVSVVRDARGRPLKGLGIVQDITERRRALADAQVELERLARDHDRILEFAGEGIYHVDERGRITFANPAAAEMLGWEAPELVGKPAHELLHHTRPDGSPYPRDECPIHGARAERTGEPLTGDVFWRRDGTGFPVHYRSAPVPGQGGAGAVVVFSDESERTEMEGALRDARERAARERLNAAEAERARWARELHDETLQGLAALHVLLSARIPAATVEALQERMRRAQEEIESEMDKLRALISELRPAALDELGLEASLVDLADRTQAVYGIEVDTRVDLGAGTPRRLEPEVETAAYRIVQECLSNAARHAGAARVAVELARANGTLVVRVDDDGQGFDVAGAGAGFGLRGMRERVDLLDGRLTIGSHAGRGTTVTAALPL